MELLPTYKYLFHNSDVGITDISDPEWNRLEKEEYTWSEINDYHEDFVRRTKQDN